MAKKVQEVSSRIRTEEDFEVFKAECKRWLKIFGLTDWEIHFHFSEDCVSTAAVQWEPVSRIVDVHLGHESHYSGKGTDVAKFAGRHEMLHLLLADYHVMCRARTATEEEIAKQDERLVRILENAFEEVENTRVCLQL